MITKKNLAAIIFILVGIAIVLIYRGCGSTPIKPVIIPVKTQQQAVQKKDDEMRIKMEYVIAGVDKIIAENKSLKATYEWQKKSAQKMEGIIHDLQQEPDKTPSDNYDHAVNDYISNANEKDSSCNFIIDNLNSQLAYKDSVIVLKDNFNEQLRISFNTAIIQQTSLSEYSRQLNRQLRIKKAGNFIWKTAAVVAGLFILKNSL